MGPIWDRQEPGGPRVGPMNFAVQVILASFVINGKQNQVTRQLRLNDSTQDTQSFFVVLFFVVVRYQSNLTYLSGSRDWYRRNLIISRSHESTKPYYTSTKINICGYFMTCSLSCRFVRAINVRYSVWYRVEPESQPNLWSEGSKAARFIVRYIVHIVW